MNVPERRQATIHREKITDYLLSLSHPRGRGKAGFLIRFGFHAERWWELERALRSHVLQHDVVEVEETPYGLKYNVDGELETPDGRNPVVRTVWQVDHGSSEFRFITAIPVG